MKNYKSQSQNKFNIGDELRILVEKLPFFDNVRCDDVTGRV